jgi:hypothetical protein
MIILAFSSANFSAMERPIPLDPPVIITTLELELPICLPFSPEDVVA